MKSAHDCVIEVTLVPTLSHRTCEADTADPARSLAENSVSFRETEVSRGGLTALFLKLWQHLREQVVIRL